MTYMGIDASLTATGIIVLDEKGKLVHSLYPCKWRRKYPKDRGAKRLTYYRDCIKWLVRRLGVTCVAIEDYAYGNRKSSQSFSMGELGGVIKQVVDEEGAGLHLVGIKHLKKWAGLVSPKEVEKGLSKCWKCGGKFVGNRGNRALKTSALEETYRCKKCGNGYTEKSDVICYVRKKLNCGHKFPWEPLDFDALNMKKKVPPVAAFESATEKVVSDLCDGYVLAELIFYFQNKTLWGDLEGRQLAVLSQFVEKK